jgi:DNA-directed RNA polymerase I subunit RPA1
MNISVPIGHEIGGISFSFVSSEQVKKLSVKSLNNPITFDPISNHPNSNGVYDPALGPTDRHQL